ncbi:PREDICTED: serine-rich adhesin for platelets isoform X1 [Dinoponera quadriceps]|uniref:Serine-rich adhesin for platelets isoform X1 n=1 Tax=Dinoponera quadriceps TaxID=609295 RepID=A0A6P3XC71_DINQU|nr:PREDICTED: serine-rich adhesin for platelets isoform X1 [Dinoponera quadriceps]XP_014475401.1 PREDICTED: serine-rich adhesin for platelets isoform X2 [Dinoponera quadriceps]XP_014475489.1 PREDICTED: serine-rich adhesin for platelets isoform X1 [Dinoponera quadriceps]XP_014475562.1 PREDICTED: serine-rich adhesin for platelets isoform X1 [Dinoponera quadriceps]
MEGDDGPSAISSKPTIIKAAQEEMGRLDVLVCGQCHSVFHFIEEFQEHRTKVGVCSQVSHFRENNDNGQKAQVWAFLLWKDSQIQHEGSDKDATNPWKLYQKWCKMDPHVRDSWITAGKTIQTFTKISNAKMQDTPRQIQSNTTEGTKPIVVRKVIRNGQPEDTTIDTKKDITKTVETKTQEPMEVEMDNKREKPKLKPSVKPKNKTGKTVAATDEDVDQSNEEYVVEKILAKRLNTKKKCAEYLIKWEGYAVEDNTWEPAENVAVCKNLLEEFERNLAKQKELKAAQQQANTKVVARTSLSAQKPVIKVEASKPGPSTASQAGRPMRSSKSKAMDQVKQWVGSMKDEDNDLTGKRRIDYSDSDSEEGGGGGNAAKRTKADTGSDDEWTGESEDERLMGRSDVIQRAFNRANAQSNGSNRAAASVSTTDLATSLGLQSPEGAKSSNQPPVLVANAKGVVKVDPKQMPNLTSGVYVMSRKDGIIKLDSSPSGKLAVKGSPTTTQGVLMVQNRDNTNVVRKQVISSQSNSMTPVKVVSKMDGSQVVTQMKVVSKSSITPKGTGSVVAQKTEPIKIQPKPDPSQLQQIHVVTAVPAPITLQPRITTSIRPASVTPQRTADGRPLLPRPALRATAPTSVLGTIRSPVRAPSPRQQIQSQTPRQALQKRTTTTVVSTTGTVSPSAASSGGTVTQIRPKFTMLTTQPKQVIKTGGTSLVQQIQKHSPKSSLVGKTHSLSPQQKLLMIKKKAQEAAGITKPSGRGLLAGAARGAAVTTGGRGRATAKVMTTAESPVTIAHNKPKESKLAEGDGLHMEFHEVGSEESSSEGEPDLPPPSDPDSITAPEPDSPPRPFTLCPLTGRIMGPDGEPIEQQTEQEPEPPTPVAMLTKTTSITSETSSDATMMTTAITTTTTTTTSTTTVMATTTNITTATTTISTSNNNNNTTTTTTGATAELVLPSLDSLATENGGMVRVEMSPGGTTGTIVQTGETAQINLSSVTVPAADLPCLDDTASVPSTTTATTANPETTSGSDGTETPSITTALSTVVTASTPTVTMSTVVTGTATEAHNKTTTVEEKISEERKVATDEASNLVTIAEHGVVYQVAGQAEDGQTLLVTRGADGEQQCVYVTTEQQGDDGSVLTLDHAVAEAVAQLIPDQVNLTPQFYVKEDGAEPAENSMVMSIMDNANATDVSAGTGQEDNDGQAQVVAQVVQAEEPTPGGTRRVVLLLPDGNFMMTEVDEEQYAALELDK